MEITINITANKKIKKVINYNEIIIIITLSGSVIPKGFRSLLVHGPAGRKISIKRMRLFKVKLLLIGLVSFL